MNARSRHRRWWDALLLGFALLSTAAAAQNPGSPESLPSDLDRLRAQDQERRAGLAAAAGRYREAAGHLERAAELRRNVQIQVEVAWRYFDAGDYSAMLRAAQLCRQAQPGYGNASSAAAVAETLTRSDRLDWGPVSATLRGVEAPPQPQPVALASPQGQVALAHLLYKQGTGGGRARRILERVAREHPDLPEAHQLLADLYRALGMAEESRKERAEAARLDPEAPRNAIYRIWRLRAVGRREEASRWLQELLEGNSRNLVERIIELYDYAGNPAEVEEILTQALTEDARRAMPRHLLDLDQVFRLYLARDRFPQLEQLLLALRKARPADSGLLFPLMATLLLSRQPERATALAAEYPFLRSDVQSLAFYAALAAGDRARAAEWAPAHPAPMVALLLHWLDPQKHPEPAYSSSAFWAVFQVFWPHLQTQPVSRPPSLSLAARYAAVEQVVARNPTAWPALMEHAVILKDRGQVEAAVPLVRRVMDLRPGWWPSLLFLYTYYQAAGRYTEADGLFEALNRVRPAGLQVARPRNYPLTIAGAAGIEAGFSPEVRTLREAQRRMLNGELDGVEPILRGLADGPLRMEARRTLGALYLAQGNLEAAQREWAGAGYTPSPSSILRGYAPRPPWVPPFLEQPASEVPDKGARLADYPRTYLAVQAAELFAQTGARPEASRRLVEFLLRFAVEREKDYLPALYSLAHLLALPEYRSGLAGPLARPTEAAVREAHGLMERVLRRKPGDLDTLWALGRNEEAARSNPDSVDAWKRLLRDPSATEAGREEARKQLRALRPRDPPLMRELLFHLAARDPAGARREAVAIHQELGEGYGLSLAGVLAWRAGEWSEASAYWNQVVTAPGGWRRREGYPLSLLLALSLLAAGDAEAARPHAEAAARADTSDPLARLLLAWYAERAGAAAERDYQLAASSGQPVTLSRSAGDLKIDLEPVLEAIRRRHPDCFPARYVLAHHRAWYAEPGVRHEANRQAEAEKTLIELSARFPLWSAPVASLARNPTQHADAPGEALRRRAGEARLLTRTRVQPRRPALTLPGEPLRGAEFDPRQGIPRWFGRLGGAAAWGSGEPRLFEARSGALVQAFSTLPVTPLSGFDDGPLLTSSSQGLAALEPLTGELLWTVAWKPGIPRKVVAAGPRAVAVGDDGSLTAIDLASGNTLWEQSAPVGKGALAVAGPDLLYLAEKPGRVHAVELKSGRPVFSMELGPVGPMRSAVREVNQLVSTSVGLLVRVSLDGDNTTGLALLEERTGKVRWTLVAPGQSLSQVVQAAGTVVLIRTGSQDFYGIDLREGRLNAFPNLERDLRFRHAAGGWLAFYGSENRLALVDPRTGGVAWDRRLPSETPTLHYESGQWIAVGYGRIEWWSDAREVERE